MIQESIFYRRYGVRLPQQLLSPHINSIDFLEFPKLATYHYTEVDNIAVGPAADEYMFRNIAKKIAVRHVLTLSSLVGNPKLLSVPVEPLIRAWHSKNRRFRWLRENDAVPTDENQLMVVNHALCSKRFKYIRSPFADYNRWLNINATVFHQLGKVAKDSGRHQYAIFKLPRQLPSVPRLNLFSTKTSQQMLKTFSDEGAAFILELWKWLDSATRAGSTLNYADPEQYSKINIVFEDSGNWILFNLGLLDSWVFAKDRSEPAMTAAVEGLIVDVKDFAKYLPSSVSLEGIGDYYNALGLEDAPGQKVKILPDQIRKRILRSLMALMERRTIESSGGEVESEVSESTGEVVATAEEATQMEEEGKTLTELKLESLDNDLKQLELIEKESDIEESIAEVKQAEAQKVIVTNEPVNIHDFEVQKDAHFVVKDMCDRLASGGLLSGAEYRRMLAINDKGQTLESPVPGVKLGDYVKITEDDVKVKEAVFPDRVTVLDKEQLKSTLNHYDQAYIAKMLKKETVAMAVATQKAGFVITDYKVEELENILGGQEVHSFKVNPVIGKPSTLYFKVPKIDESGEFMIGGNNYRMRKQRTDLPFRKISHDRVQLSSYYGKVFVSRSDKRVNDYAEWLLKSINEKGMLENSGVTAVKPGNVFNNLSKTPIAYSCMARNIREVESQGYTLHFDIKKCAVLYGEELMAKYKSLGFLVFGDNKKGTYLLIDENNTLYTTDSKTEPAVLSTFEEFFNLDSFKAPVPYAECRIFGQPVPIGMVLGYYYGLGKLLNLLKVTPRKVLAGQRANLQAHEWQMDFSDETLIFNKEDKLATLILAGFNDFAKSLKNYSVYKFDSKGVYLSVLEQKKISTRFVREFDLLDDMFVDPITESLLVIMKEPITFRALLVRSAEVLLIDYHPNALDMNYQTIRGYERVAGAVYSEMVLSVRDHRRSLGRSNTQISLNPLAVWKRITSDPAVKICEDINPVNNLKEMEAVTFSGVGGRSSATMNTASRIYDDSNKGVVSEATSDSSDVGINTYTVPNPAFNSVRGTSDRVADKDLSGTTMLSTSANLAVGSDTDD